MSLLIVFSSILGKRLCKIWMHFSSRVSAYLIVDINNFFFVIFSVLKAEERVSIHYKSKAGSACCVPLILGKAISCADIVGELFLSESSVDLNWISLNVAFLRCGLNINKMKDLKRKATLKQNIYGCFWPS